MILTSGLVRALVQLGLQLGQVLVEGLLLPRSRLLLLIAQFLRQAPHLRLTLPDTPAKRGRWGDGTSQNDVSPYECSRNPGPLDELSRKHNIPALIHPCQFAPTKTYCIKHNDRDVSIQDIVPPGTIHLGTKGLRAFVRGHIVSGRPDNPPRGRY